MRKFGFTSLLILALVSTVALAETGIQVKVRDPSSPGNAKNFAGYPVHSADSFGRRFYPSTTSTTAGGLSLGFYTIRADAAMRCAQGATGTAAALATTVWYIPASTPDWFQVPTSSFNTIACVTTSGVANAFIGREVYP